MVTRNAVGRWAGIAGVVGPLLWWVVSIVLGLLWPTYSAVSDPISLLAAIGAPHALIQQLNFYVFGASIVLFAIGLLVWSDRGWRLLIGVPLMLVFGVGVILGGFFQHDPNNLQAATTQYHMTVSLVTFLAAIPAIAITSWGLNHEAHWPNYRHRFIPLGIALLAVATLAIFIQSIDTGPPGWEGLGQRLFLLVLTGWLAYHAHTLYHLSTTTNPTK